MSFCFQYRFYYGNCLESELFGRRLEKMKGKKHKTKLETHEVNGATGNEASVAIIIKSVYETQFPMEPKIDAFEIYENLEHHLPFSTFIGLRRLFKANKFGKLLDDIET